MKVCIIGGGNIGTTLACYIKHYASRNYVVLYTRRPEEFNDLITCNECEKGITYKVKVDCVTNELKEAVADASIIYVTIPHFAIEKTFKMMAPYVDSNAQIGVVPGCGGCEFFFYQYFPETVALFGFQRVPFIARLVVYGNETNLKSLKPHVVTAVLRRKHFDAVYNNVSECALNVEPAENYLSITLTPTNPILHTAGLYDLLMNKERDFVFARKIKFYEEWTDRASEVMLGMDTELHLVIAKLQEKGVRLCKVKSLLEHYGVRGCREMTEKISHIKAFQNIEAPMVNSDTSDGYVMKVDSRMFMEDFPWGLAIIKGFCELLSVRAPYIDRVLIWFSRYMGLDYYLDGNFCGKDLISTGIPQNYGYDTVEKIMELYMN